jgi:hypothetical protein
VLIPVKLSAHRFDVDRGTSFLNTSDVCRSFWRVIQGVYYETHTMSAHSDVLL